MSHPITALITVTSRHCANLQHKNEQGTLEEDAQTSSQPCRKNSRSVLCQDVAPSIGVCRAELRSRVVFELMKPPSLIYLVDFIVEIELLFETLLFYSDCVGHGGEESQKKLWITKFGTPPPPSSKCGTMIPKLRANP